MNNILKDYALKAIKDKGIEPNTKIVASVVSSLRFAGLNNNSSKKELSSLSKKALASYMQFNGSNLRKTLSEAKEKKVVSVSTDFSGLSCPRCGKPMVNCKGRVRKMTYCLGCRIALPFKVNESEEQKES